MENKTCKIDGCGRPLRAIGMCVKHYRHHLESGARQRVVVPHEIRSVQILALLPNSHIEMARAIGCTRKSIEYHVGVMMEAGKCHIGTFKRQKGTSGLYKPWIVLGPGVNAECRLQAQPGSVYSRRYRAKIKGTGCDADIASTNRSAARNLIRKKKSADPLVAFLFGMAS